MRLPDNTVIEGQLLFFNKHYDIALLEISSESDLPLQLPSFGSNPNYGQEVFVLARDEESNLMARHGSILWFDGLDFLQRNYHMFLSCNLPGVIIKIPCSYRYSFFIAQFTQWYLLVQSGTGGPVIDHDGNFIGMAFETIGPKSSILAISTILTCIEMWSRFRFVNSPRCCIDGIQLIS